MKYRIIKIIALLLVVIQLTSCYTRVKTDRQYYGHKRYHRAGNYW